VPPLEGIAAIAAADDDWPGWTVDEVASYYARGADYGIALRTPKQQALADLSRARELGIRALRRGDCLAFRGD